MRGPLRGLVLYSLILFIFFYFLYPSGDSSGLVLYSIILFIFSSNPGFHHKTYDPITILYLSGVSSGLVLYLLILSISSTNPNTHHITHSPLSESMDSYHLLLLSLQRFLLPFLTSFSFFFPYSYFSFSIFSRIFQLINYFLSVSSSQGSFLFFLFLFLSFFLGSKNKKTS